ncbi:uncharacterized protein LOC126614086 isoform X1 [Malus sylvestris]|uniref:uncharacterized protein LOC126614086 isoform X1 n=1 Tax=Malus sylvestris TaxID=3752 RepID=UPI0021ABF4BC|nr:uncharacterized protein LOC126614086 isoform X1 [Malus sylvestris]XP_050137672.1 uncharacterized protein LOC126614086 isoform X1 [Malus sylvestris]XP_050137673.1 uncharacterized protein LOC126614086 isoform X1 [Malus sylvestris]XP_050137674.1 uncharacterized protein LOC126614086 isoform X1 [Malus sylvestris]XP_050137675.1 uncharacterized protein LOC126614086 isoform X1 [Malus sylvestris]
MESGKGNFNLLMENAGPESVDSGLLMENVDAGSEDTLSTVKSGCSKVSEMTVECVGTGTVLCAIVLPKGVLMASDARITNLESTKSNCYHFFFFLFICLFQQFLFILICLFFVLVLYPEKKLWEIREEPPIYSSWCHYNQGGVAFMQYLKREAVNRNLADLVEVSVDHLKHEITENFNLQCYICSVEQEVPKAYVISRFCDIVHVKNCKADSCTCSEFQIDCWPRELYYGVYCMGSGGQVACKSLKYSFKGNFESDAHQWSIELLKINQSAKFEEADVDVLLALLSSSFTKVSCGAPFLISRIPCVGKSQSYTHDFLPSLKRCFSLLGRMLDNSVFLIYRQALEGSDFGEVVVENMIGGSNARNNGIAVAVMEGNYVLHFLKLRDGNCRKYVLSLFGPVTADEDVPNVDQFCRSPTSLMFGKLDMLMIADKVETHGLDVAEINDMEYVFLGLPTIDFIDSLVEVGSATLLP